MTHILIPRATLEQVLSALESVEALIEYQYTGTRLAMSDLQYTCDDAHSAVEILLAALAQPAPARELSDKDLLKLSKQSWGVE